MGNEQLHNPEASMSDSERALHEFGLEGHADELFIVTKGGETEVVQGRDIFARGGKHAEAMMAAYRAEPVGSPNHELYKDAIRTIALGYMANPAQPQGE